MAQDTVTVSRTDNPTPIPVPVLEDAVDVLLETLDNPRITDLQLYEDGDNALYATTETCERTVAITAARDGTLTAEQASLDVDAPDVTMVDTIKPAVQEEVGIAERIRRGD